MDQIAAHGQIVDHLRIIAHGKGADRGTRKTGKIGGATKFFEALVVFHKRLERDGAGQIVFGDTGGGNVKDARVHGVVEMLGPMIDATRS